MSEKKRINIRTADQLTVSDKTKCQRKFNTFMISNIRILTEINLSLRVHAGLVGLEFLDSLNIPKLSDENKYDQPISKIKVFVLPYFIYMNL